MSQQYDDERVRIVRPNEALMTLVLGGLFAFVCVAISEFDREKWRVLLGAAGIFVGMIGGSVTLILVGKAANVWLDRLLAKRQRDRDEASRSE